MKIFSLVLIMVSFSLFSMDRQHSVVSVDSGRRSPFGDIDSSRSQGLSSDEEDLCDFAISRYVPGISGIERYLKPFLKPLLQEVPSSPELTHVSSNAEILRVAKASDRTSSSMASAAHDVKSTSPLSVADQKMYDMIVKAMHSAVEDRERALEEKERQLILKEARIKEKYSGKKTAAIAAATGTISTIVTTICATMVTLSSK